MLTNNVIFIMTAILQLMMFIFFFFRMGIWQTSLVYPAVILEHVLLNL